MDVLVPLKRLDRAKARLEGRLDPEARAGLMRALLERTLAQAAAAPSLGRIVLVTSDPAGDELAAAHGVERFDDSGAAWNDALAAAMRAAVRSDDVLILSADLPLVTSADLEALVAAAPPRGLAIARARDRGTNAVLMRPAGAVATSFGLHGAEGSAAEHARLAAEAGLEAVIVDIPGLAADIDSPEDLAELGAGFV